MPALRQLYTIVKRNVSQSPIFSKPGWARRRYRSSQVHFLPKYSSDQIPLSDRSDSCINKDEKARWSDLESRKSGNPPSPMSAVHACSASSCGCSVNPSRVLQIADEVKITNSPATARQHRQLETTWQGQSTYNCKIEGGVKPIP